ncbi:MAG TPA: hypothetical protein VIO11_04025, partial [Candidatus Methanoperedens sp.]
MKLQLKLFLSFAVLILILGSATMVSTSVILRKELEHMLVANEENGLEVLKSNIFPYIANKGYDEVTGMLFDYKTIRKVSIYYIFVDDNKGKILAHTFLDEMPDNIKNHGPHKIQDFLISESIVGEVPVIEIAVVIKEGTYEAGHLHVGYRKEYIESIVSQNVDSIIFILVILTVSSIFLSFFMAKFMVKPINEFS